MRGLPNVMMRSLFRHERNSACVGGSLGWLHQRRKAHRLEAVNVEW